MAETLLNPYCSVEDVKDVIKYKQTDTIKDNEIIRCINLASRWIDERQRRDFFFHDNTVTPIVLTRYSDRVEADKILLPYRPVISITEIKEGDVVMVQDADYVIDESIIYKRFGHWLPMYTGVSNFPSDTDMQLLPAPLATNVSIKGTFGYTQASSGDVPALPQHIRFCAMQVAAVFTGHNRKETVGLDGQRNEIVTSEIPKSVFDILGRRAPILI